MATRPWNWAPVYFVIAAPWLLHFALRPLTMALMKMGWGQRGRGGSKCKRKRENSNKSGREMGRERKREGES